MNKCIRASFSHFSALLILISACAKISTPSGGPRDRLPPVVVKCIPDNGSKNFRAKSFAITFNEYVTLDKITDKFMVSPPMKKKPKVFLKGKSVNVEFDEKLKDSTTYTFYFQDAIRDLNEGNIIDNYQFVVSTGPVLDSLSVTGNVYTASNLEVPEKTLVLLYRELADSSVVRHLPDYISRVDQTGYFRINNVRAGIYRLYALKDGDNSKNYNLPDEDFAFLNTPIEITPEKNFLPVVKDTTLLKKEVTRGVTKGATKGVLKVTELPVLKGEYQLFLFTAQKKAHYLTKSSRDLKYQMTYVLSLPPDSMKFEFSIPGVSNDNYIIENSRYRDTLKVWLKDSTLYSQPQIKTIVEFPFTDTLGTLGYKEDTIVMRFLAPRAPRVAKVKKPALSVGNNLSSGSVKPGQKIVFKSETPFKQPDTARIRLYEILNTDKIKIPYILERDSSNSSLYLLNVKLSPGKKYLFVAKSAAFGNIYNDYSDSIGINFSIKDPESYSKLTLDIKNYEGDRIIQLLDKSEKLIAENYMKKDGKTVFPLLETGFYRVRVIYDLNGDRKWTTGDFTTHRQPEPVSYYPAEIELKSGWELEYTNDQAWDIGVNNFKDQKLREKVKTK